MSEITWTKRIVAVPLQGRSIIEVVLEAIDAADREPVAGWQAHRPYKSLQDLVFPGDRVTAANLGHGRYYEITIIDLDSADEVDKTFRWEPKKTLVKEPA